jgi:hypothetical protein
MIGGGLFKADPFVAGITATINKFGLGEMIQIDLATPDWVSVLDENGCNASWDGARVASTRQVCCGRRRSCGTLSWLPTSSTRRQGGL